MQAARPARGTAGLTAVRVVDALRPGVV